MFQFEDKISELIQESITVKLRLLNDPSYLSLINQIAGSIVDALKRGNKIMFCGNGGSFADSIHLAAEFVARFQKERKSFAGIALGTNTSILTAVSNDYSYKEVFSREIEAIGNKGDILLAISTSGNSESVLQAVTIAMSIGIHVFGMTGESGGRLAEIAHCFKVPSSKTARIQESHILVGHIICELVEDALVESSPNF